MTRTFGYYPGCSLRGTGIAYEESLFTLFSILGVELEELHDWNCCGATSYMSTDERSAFVLSARNLEIAHQSNLDDLLAPCAACYLVLRKTQDYVVRYPEIGRQVDESLAAGVTPEQLAGIRVRHPLEVLFTDVGGEKIRSKVVRKWQGGRAACYYGCQIVRPYGEVDQEPNPESMDRLLGAVGVPTVDYALKTRCCGGALTGTIHEVGLFMNQLLLREAIRKGAECIVTVCPLCQHNLDAYQTEMRGGDEQSFDMPVLYFTQVLGWMLGGDPEKLGFRRSISGRRLIARWFPRQAREEAYA